MPIAPAICDIIAIWLIISSCSIIGFAKLIAAMSIPPIPFIGKPPFIIIMFGSGEPFVMLSMRAWTSSCWLKCGPCPPRGPMRSSRLRCP